MERIILFGGFSLFLSVFAILLAPQHPLVAQFDGGVAVFDAAICVACIAKKIDQRRAP